MASLFPKVSFSAQVQRLLPASCSTFVSLFMVNSPAVTFSSISLQRPALDAVHCSLRLLASSASRLQVECRKAVPLEPGAPAVDYQLLTQQVIQCAYDIAKAAKQLVTITTREKKQWPEHTARESERIHGWAGLSGRRRGLGGQRNVEHLESWQMCRMEVWNLEDSQRRNESKSVEGWEEGSYVELKSGIRADFYRRNCDERSRRWRCTMSRMVKCLCLIFYSFYFGSTSSVRLMSLSCWVGGVGGGWYVLSLFVPRGVRMLLFLLSWLSLHLLSLSNLKCCPGPGELSVQSRTPHWIQPTPHLSDPAAWVLFPGWGFSFNSLLFGGTQHDLACFQFFLSFYF